MSTTHKDESRFLFPYNAIVQDPSNAIQKDFWCYIRVSRIDSLSPSDGVVEHQQPVQAANPAVVVVLGRVALARSADDTGYAALPVAAAGLANHFALDADLGADWGAGAAFAVDADFELAVAVLAADFQRHLGVERKYQRAEAETSGADWCDEERFDEGVNDGAASAEAVSS